jgi:hypothetical protein
MSPPAGRRPPCMVRGVVVLVREGEEISRWPLLVRDAVDLGLVDQLARLQLAARRIGCAIELRDACPELLGLLDLVGLRVEMGGQPEDLEQVRVEEVVVPDDPVA